MKRVLIVCALSWLGSRPARAEEIDYKKLYAQVAPGVVYVEASDEKGGGHGTGSIIRSDGLVVTNAHVILCAEKTQPCPKIFVALKPERVTGRPEDDFANVFQAQVLAHSADFDLALLRIVNAPRGLRVVEISDDSNVGVGESVAAIGHPEHGGNWSLTTGRISAEHLDYHGLKGWDVYQTETSINRGNSGGPLLDGNGSLIGVNAFMFRRSEDGLALTGLNYAIKSTVVRAWIGLVNEKISAAPEVRAQSLPSPKVIAQAPPAPPAEEPAAPSGGPPREAKTSVVPPPPPGAKRVSVSSKVPPPPPRKARGFTSSTPPGKVLSSSALTRQHARDAFDELDRETDDLGPRGGK